MLESRIFRGPGGKQDKEEGLRSAGQEGLVEESRFWKEVGGE